MMQIDGNNLIEGKLYLWKLPRQNVQAKDLHSIYFVTEDDRFYEVVFAKPTDANPVPGWYLVEKEVKREDTTPEAEIVEPTAIPNSADESLKSVEQEVSDNSTLSIAVDDELKLGERLN